MTDAEMALLARGVNPFIIRNSNLVCYAPIHGNESPENQFGSEVAQTGTLTGTTKVTHPPVELLEIYL